MTKLANENNDIKDISLEALALERKAHFVKRMSQRFPARAKEIAGLFELDVPSSKSEVKDSISL